MTRFIAVAVAVLLMLASCVQAAPVVLNVEGSFNLSGFTDVKPDPFVLTFSKEITIDSSLLDSDFSVDTNPSTIVPSPLTIGTGTFFANDIDLRLKQDTSLDEGGVFVTIGIDLSRTTGGTNDFVVNFSEPLVLLSSSLPLTINNIDNSLLANVGVPGSEFPSVRSGSVTISAIPEPSAFAFLGLIGLIACGRSWWKRR